SVRKRTLQTGGGLAIRAVVRHPVLQVGRGFHPVFNANQREVIEGESVGESAEWQGGGNFQPRTTGRGARVGVDQQGRGITQGEDGGIIGGVAIDVHDYNEVAAG